MRHIAILIGITILIVGILVVMILFYPGAGA